MILGGLPTPLLVLCAGIRVYVVPALAPGTSQLAAGLWPSCSLLFLIAHARSYL